MTPQERKNFESIRDNVHGEPMTQVEAMKLALEALETIDGWLLERYPCGLMPKELEAITALRQAIEQAQKQEPAFYAHDGYLMTPERAKFLGFPLDSILALYTSPPQQKQEPVAYQDTAEKCRLETAPAKGTLLNTSPPQPQPLTLNQLREHWQVAKVLDMTDAEIDFADYVLIARDVEALHGIKENTKQDGNCKHCVNGCTACDARKLKEKSK